MSTTAPETVFLLYERGHVEVLEHYWAEHPAERARALVVALSPEIEAQLAAKGIEVSSGRTYIPQDTSRFILAEKWTSELFESKEWEWFRYRGISLSPVFFYPIQLYLTQLLYYGAAVQAMLVQYSTVRRLVVFASLQTAPPRGKILVRKQIAAPAACAQAVGMQRGVEVMTVGESLTQDIPAESPVTRAQRGMLERGISVVNTTVAFLRRPGRVRILATDYWRNISPIMAQLPHGELMLYDRGEALNAGMRNIWRYRMRFFNAEAFSTQRRGVERAQQTQIFEERWRALRAALPEYSYAGFSVRTLLMEALDEVVLEAAPQTLPNIDGTFAMLRALAPGVVLLRISNGAQAHFVVLALVAKACGIPSLELQHGLEYAGPGSYARRSAEYVAVYGAKMQDELAALGYRHEKLPIIGSPRFDFYLNDGGHAAPKRQESGISVLCMTHNPDTPWAGYDRYDMEDYFRGIARALERIPNSNAVIKLRPGQSRDGWYRAVIDREFVRVPHTIAEHEPLDGLFASADIVISYYSTAVLEALLCRKPVIVFSTQTMEREIVRTHLQPYVDAGGLMTAYTEEELASVCFTLVADETLRQGLAQRARKVLAHFNLFDGRASEHIVELIERLAQKQKNDF